MPDDIGRVVERWRQLPLDRAAAAFPLVRAALHELAVAARGPDISVPDLGLAAVADQLRVLADDVSRANPAYPLAERLTQLRRRL